MKTFFVPLFVNCLFLSAFSQSRETPIPSAPNGKSATAEGIQIHGRIPARLARYFSSASELFPKKFPKVDGVDRNQFRTEFRFQKEIVEALKKATPDWAIYSEVMPEKSYQCIRNAMALTLFVFCESASHIPGKFLIEPISFKGRPVISDAPFFPTKYRVKFISNKASEDKPDFEFDIEIEDDPDKCEGPTDKIIDGWISKLLKRYPPKKQATK